MIDRITAAVNGRQIVLSLSGGYDSRYIACSLKDKGIENVVCYTYGKYDSFEVAQSKKVAEALNYSWYNVQYDEKDIRKLIHENEYFDYANRPDYSVYLQNFLAVKYLHDNKIISDDAVCITGLCNDMPTGSYIPSVESLHGKYDFSNLGFSYYELDRNFQIFSISEEAKDLYIKDVLTFLDFMKINVTNYQEFVSALDCFETSMIHSRCYLNANTVHEFFGYEWLLPCWDRELLSFWYELPIEFRYKQHLYEVYITEHLASKYGVGTKKHLISHVTTPFRRKIKRKIGGILDKILYPLGIPIRRKTDINNFAGLEVDLYKNILQKKAVKKADRAALILLLTIYIMERRYGTNWYDTIKKYLE